MYAEETVHINTRRRRKPSRKRSTRQPAKRPEPEYLSFHMYFDDPAVTPYKHTGNDRPTYPVVDKATHERWKAGKYGQLEDAMYDDDPTGA